MPRLAIHQLSPALVNRIAAGEVIERPASVVKELVENSLDAGATEILVEIEDGGRELIRIIDNGSGIPAEELPLAFAEHATSKLASDEDLFRISTMGFRGEALASIGSVSQARLLSRTATSPAAYEIFNRGGAITAAQAAAGNVGTTLEVRNLFYNTPARRKFLRGASTEAGHVSETLLRLALAYPAVSFKLLHGGRTSLNLPATSPEERLLDAWPDEFREQRLPIDVRDAEIHLGGIIGLPDLARPTGKYQFLYLNGRHIRDKFVSHALREAFRGLTEPGRYPAAILLLEMPPQDVDVNVHPTKIEVRFRDSGRIHGLILSAVREKLLGSDLTPNATAIPVTPLDPVREDMRAKLAAFFQQMPSSTVSADASPGAAFSSPSMFAAAPAPMPREPWSLLAQAPRERLPLESPAPIPSSPPSASPPPQASPLEPARGSAIQLHNTYLVSQTEEGMVIIDQHALHERIMYEDLKTRLTRGPLESQRLLMPISVPATPRQMDLLEQIQPLLERLGIEIAPFGPDTLAVQSFPTFLDRLDPGIFVRELLERGEQELLDLHEEELLHELMDMMACKAAVKAGDPLSAAEIEALLSRRELVERSSNCPHGRPTTLRLSLRDLEKQFKRTGF